MSITGLSFFVFFPRGTTKKKEKKNSNKAVGSQLHWKMKKNEAVSGESKEGRRGQTVRAASPGAGETHLQRLNQDEVGGGRRGEDKKKTGVQFSPEVFGPGFHSIMSLEMKQREFADTIAL